MPLESRSWWLREALAAAAGLPCPPLTGRVKADVAIVGGHNMPPFVYVGQGPAVV